MLNKIYLCLLGVSTALMAFFTYYSWSWLQSIGLPAAAAEGYRYHADLAWYTLWITFVALLMLGNGVLWATRSSWAMWTSYVYFAVFAVIDHFWLGQAAFHFKKANGLWDGSFSLGPFFGAFLISAVGVFVFVDHFMVVRLYRRMFPPAPDEPTNENANEIPEVTG